MKIRPLGDKVLVQRTEAETKTAGGIVLPDTAKEKPQRGKVISVGEGKTLDDGSKQQMQVGTVSRVDLYDGTVNLQVGTNQVSMDDVVSVAVSS